MKNAHNVPKLRFPEFWDAGEWEFKEVGKVFNVTRGEVLSMTLVQDAKTEEIPYPVYSSQTKNNGLSGFYSEYLYEDAITWTTDGANAGDVNYRLGKFYCTNVCGVLINTDGYANPCVAALINSVAKKYVSYVGNPKLMNGVMSKIKIPFPFISEQKKIADCLFSIDDRITAETQKLDTLKAHKKGLMQQLFPTEGQTLPQLRFPGFHDSGEWDEKRLEDLSIRGSGHTPNKSEPSYYNGGIKWVSLADSNKLDNRYIYETKIEISKEGLKNSSAVLHPSGTVIISRDAGVGKSAVLHSPMAVSQHFIVWRCDDSKLSNWFLYYFLQVLKPQFEAIATGSTIKTIGLPYFKELRIFIPSLPEQQRIADCLTSLDELISLRAQKIDLLKLHKKGLMQQLFPSVNGEE